MSGSIQSELRKELVARGFSPSLASPNDTMVLDDAYATAADLAGLLELMVARREKIFRSVDVVGAGAAKRSYDDVVLCIDAIKAVIARLPVVPRE